MEKIKYICSKYCDLSEKDIEIIEKVAVSLQLIANIEKADVFIDCLTIDSEAAIVVAEAKPNDYVSAYKSTVMGQLALKENEPAVIRTLELGTSTRDVKAVTQEHTNVVQTVEPIKNDDNKVIAVLIIEKDITDNINASKKMEFLAETNEKLANELTEKKNDDGNITYHLDDAVIVFDSDGIVRFKNRVAEDFYKNVKDYDNLIGMDFCKLALDDKIFDDIVKNNSIQADEVDVGELYLSIKYIVQNSKVLKVVMVIRDITDIKNKEKELILKSVALKEIHHRVKNNLQTIASLLRLQSRRIKNEEFKNASNESMNRILSISATHEILAQHGIDEINVKELIEKVSKSIIRSSQVNKKMIEVDIVGDEFVIDSEKSTSIGLIINEIVLNSLKYAFDNKEEGRIKIDIQKGQIYSSISIIDNGSGFDRNKANKNSLGLTIVRSLVKDKLYGNLSIESNSNGTKVSFDFKN